MRDRDAGRGPHHDIVGSVADGRALIEAASRLQPELIILDITMPLLNGIDAAVQIKKGLPGVKLLFVTMHVNPAYLEAALEAGGTGYVLKSAAGEELLEAVEHVLKGEIYVTPSISSEHLERFKGPRSCRRYTSAQQERTGDAPTNRRGQGCQRDRASIEHHREDGGLSSRQHQEKTRLAIHRRIDQARHRARPHFSSHFSRPF